MSNDKIKTYRNRERGLSADYKPYVPQYQVLGVEPGEYKSAVLPDTVQVAAKPQEENPRARKVAVRQPYAESVPSPVGRGRGPIPNVGNNVEHTWSSVDGDIVDDLSGDENLDPDHPMIDNNDFVSPTSLGMFQETLPMLDEVEVPPRKKFTQAEVSSPLEEDLFPVVRDLEEGSYLLIVNGVPVCSGPREEIEDQAKALIFGEHEICDGNPIPDDDIVIIKRVPIKIGLFLE
jgi:hypothetical protein